MNGTTVLLLIMAAALVVSTLSLYVAWRGLTRSAHASRDEELRNAKKDAVADVREQLEAMTRDRDFWRGLVVAQLPWGARRPIPPSESDS